jgi:AraC-like DNA-binding protein
MPRRSLDLARLAPHQDEQTFPSVSELARRFHYSPSQLRARYRDATHEPLARSRRRQRLDAAATLLTQGPRSLTELALAAGYASVEAFNHAFRKRFGCAPSQFPKARTKSPSSLRALEFAVALARHFSSGAKA